MLTWFSMRLFVGIRWTIRHAVDLGHLSGEVDCLHWTNCGFVSSALGSKLDMEDAYMRTAQSSPAEANIVAFIGFQDIELTQPEICPPRVSKCLPFSLCQMWTWDSGKCQYSHILLSDL